MVEPNGFTMTKEDLYGHVYIERFFFVFEGPAVSSLGLQ